VAGLLARVRFDTVLVVLQRPTGGSASEVPALSIREARDEDAAAYERDIGTDLADRVRQRLASPGSSCWIALRGSRIVHASWVVTQSAWVGEADRFFVVPPGDAYIYESFTAPNMRGRGVYPAVLTTIAARLGDRDLTKLWIAAERTNHSSLRAIEKAGFTHTFEIEIRRRWGRTEVTVPPGIEPELRAA
jgi:ribosomal protein S18 acetylase RimI-like enzyme